MISLERSEGHSFILYWRLWRVLSKLRPAIVHTRNLAALEAQIPALFLPGARRVHGEHGRDVFDLDGSNRKYNLMRRAIRPLVQRYIAVSRDLADWLKRMVRVNSARVRQIYNGVEQDLFCPRKGERPDLAPPGFVPPGGLVIGTVGRLAEVKDQPTLVRAFAEVLRQSPENKHRLRLVIVGEGQLRPALEACIREEGIEPWVWLPRDRDDVPDLLRMLDLFVLPSLGEGISNTVLEAMATALPVVATRVGGNPELVEDGVTGRLVPPSNTTAMARAIADYAQHPERMRQHGAAGRAKVAQSFTWERCVEEYLAVYDELLGRTHTVPADHAEDLAAR